MLAHDIRCNCTLCTLAKDRPRTVTRTTKESPKARMLAKHTATKTDKKKKKT